MQDEKGKRGNERKQTLAGNQLAGGRTSSLYFGRRQSDHSGQGGNSATCAGTCEPVQGGAEGVGRAYRGTRWDRHFSCGKLEIWKGGIKHERKRNGGRTAAPEKFVEQIKYSDLSESETLFAAPCAIYNTSNVQYIGTIGGVRAARCAVNYTSSRASTSTSHYY